MSMPPAEVDHTAAAVARLRQWAKDRPNLLGLLAAFNAESQAAETALRELITKRMLDVATGDQLDTLGDIVGQLRAGADDATYRQRIRARIRLNRSSGTPEEILGVLGVALVSDEVADPQLQYGPGYIADFWIRILVEQTPETAAVMLEFLREAHAAGVRAVLEWREVDEDDVFRLDIGPGLDQGHLAGGSD